MSNLIEFKEIKEIDKILFQIREKTSTQKDKISLIVEKRNKLNSKTNNLRQEIRQKKIERDKLNNKVKNLKEKRNKTHLEIKKRISSIKKIRKCMEVFNSKNPKRNLSNIQKEFDELEWEIQTSTLELDEEKKLVEKVMILGTIIKKLKKIDDQKLKINKINQEISKLDAIAEKTHTELTHTAEKSQELHKIIIIKITELDKNKEKADKLHQTYLSLNDDLTPSLEESRKLVQRKKELLDIIKEKEEKRRKKTEENLKKKIKTEAKNKIENKEKLSWDEYKLLTESG